MNFSIKSILFFFVVLSFNQVQAQKIKNLSNEISVKIGYGLVFSAFNFIKSSNVTKYIASTDDDVFISHGTKIFATLKKGKREHLFTFEKGFGERLVQQKWNQTLIIKYSKINYNLYFSNLSASKSRFGGSFGISSSFIRGNIERRWMTQPNVSQSYDSDFWDYGLGFNIFLSYGFNGINLFFNINNYVYIRNFTANVNVVLGVMCPLRK